MPKAQDFAYRYRHKYGENPGVHAAIGYSAGQVIEAPVRSELEFLVQRISERVGRYLERQGLLVRDADSDYPKLSSPKHHGPMAQLIGSSITYIQGRHRTAARP